MAATGPIVRPSDGQPVKRVLFIQCAGSRDKDHLPYCSSACCMTTLAQTTYIHEQDPEAEVYVVYKDMRTPGQYERFYRAAQDQPLNFFTKGEVASVEKAPDGRLAVTVNHTLLGESIVLTGGPGGAGHRHGPQRQRPDSETDLPPGAGPAGAAAWLPGFALRLLPVRDPPHRNLCGRSRARAHGRGAGAPGRRGRRAEGHPVHRTGGARAGPFTRAAATCRTRRSSCSAARNASGAPKSARSARWTRTRRARRSRISTAAGAAASAWAPVPERIVSFKNYSVDMIASMIKAIEVPEEDEEKPRVLALVCENDAYPALDLAGLEAAPVRPQRARDPAALPGVAQHRVDRRRALARHRRRDAGRLQVRRRLPVPLHQGQRAGASGGWRTSRRRSSGCNSSRSACN